MGYVSIIQIYTNDDDGRGDDNDNNHKKTHVFYDK